MYQLNFSHGLRLFRTVWCNFSSNVKTTTYRGFGKLAGQSCIFPNKDQNFTMRKKLIEVALPLEAINAESAREKSIRHGHPSTMHLWWSRKPLATCRAVLFSQLVDDPSNRPEEFPTDADQERERERLFEIIRKLVKWENVNNEAVLNEAQCELPKHGAKTKTFQVALTGRSTCALWITSWVRMCQL